MNGESHSLALWTSLTVLLTNLAALNLVKFLGDDISPGWQFVAATVTAMASAGAVYTKQRRDDAKKGRVKAGTILVNDTEEKTTFTIEMEREPEELVNRKEVTFKVRKA